MSPTRRQILHATTACAAAGLAGCSAAPAKTPSGPVTLQAADVPVGGGTVLRDAPIVVTQPVAGEFKAFLSTCTHGACKVSEVRREGIFCGCHGSVFAMADGAVKRGPAATPLPALTVAVSGDTLTVS